jgi:two-component system, cell cycle sensor histidine kinase PleC
MADTPDQELQTVSEPARAVAHLLELGAHFALAERAANIGYWRQEIESGKSHWSPGFFSILGLSPHEQSPSSKFLMQHIHPDDRVKVAEEIAAAISTGRQFYYRTRSWKINSQERIFDTHGDVERDENGKISALLGLVREVTREVEAERLIKESEATYRFMTEEATDIIIRHGREGVSDFISPAVKQVLGFEPDELLGRPAFELFHQDDVGAAKSAIFEAMRTGGMTAYSYRARHKNGSYLWLESRVRFVANPQTGEYDSAISVTRDISKRKQFEEELQAARLKAEAASHTKSRFLANMSHELRTPLNAIIGFSDIMDREMFGPVANARYSEYVKLIHESGGMLLDLINDLLDMSKIEAGKFELHYEEFLIQEAIETGLALFSARAAEKSIELRSSVAPGVTHVTADRRVFKQILLNLVSNAIKFTDSGGNVLIDTATCSSGMKLCVRDSGIGMSPEFLKRIGTPFEQASNDPARTHNGSGLGLALVKSLTQLHGGTFEIKSKEGHGTEVTVTLPLVPERAAVAAR